MNIHKCIHQKLNRRQTNDKHCTTKPNSIAPLRQIIIPSLCCVCAHYRRDVFTRKYNYCKFARPAHPAHEHIYYSVAHARDCAIEHSRGAPEFTHLLENGNVIRNFDAVMTARTRTFTCVLCSLAGTRVPCTHTHTLPIYNNYRARGRGWERDGHICCGGTYKPLCPSWPPTPNALLSQQSMRYCDWILRPNWLHMLPSRYRYDIPLECTQVHVI